MLVDDPSMPTCVSAWAHVGRHIRLRRAAHHLVPLCLFFFQLCFELFLGNWISLYIFHVCTLQGESHLLDHLLYSTDAKMPVETPVDVMGDALPIPNRKIVTKFARVY